MRGPYSRLARHGGCSGVWGVGCPFVNSRAEGDPSSAGRSRTEREGETSWSYWGADSDVIALALQTSWVDEPKTLGSVWSSTGSNLSPSVQARVQRGGHSTCLCEMQI